MNCRMYDSRPARAASLCYLCAYRNGFKGCRRSRDKRVIRSAEARFAA